MKKFFALLLAITGLGSFAMIPVSLIYALWIDFELGAKGFVSSVIVLVFTTHLSRAMVKAGTIDGYVSEKESD